MSDDLKALIIETITKFGKNRIRRRQLYNIIGRKDIDYDEFKSILTELEKSGAIVRMKGRRFQLPEDTGIFSGVFTLARNGGGYIRTKEGDTVYVRPRNTEGAVTGDLVRAKMTRHSRPGFAPTAKIVGIEERSTEPIIGVFKRTDSTCYVIPREEGFQYSLIVRPGKDMDALDGNLVVVKIENPIPGYSLPSCSVMEVLGEPDAPGVDVLAIAKRHNLPIVFPEDALAAAQAIPDDLTGDIIEKRRDIRGLIIYTIDPVDAKDFDDAVSVTKTPDGIYHLGVHIADVAHYVKDGSPLDLEAEKRGMSCYLVDRVIPMLPERLSNDLCSLKPDTDRLTKSVFADIDSHGALISYDIAETVIHSSMRLTYEQVQSYLDSSVDDGDGYITPVIGESLRLLSDLTDILVSRRTDRGALDFENPEALVVLDDRGNPVDIRKREHFKAHRMIEEAMILANVITAKELAERKAPILFRVHEEPDEAKLAAFAETAEALGYRFRASLAREQAYIQAFLESIRGKNNERTLNMLLLRSMKRACYTPDNRGHYGLALPEYAHFTSPIRRYPDLIVHRQLETYVLRGDGGAETHDYGYYEALGDAVTEREIITDQAERESVKMKTAEFMSGHLGEEFEGTITGIIAIGFFVGIDKYFAEGLVHVSTLVDDYYIIDKVGVSLVGRTTGRRFMLGDRIRVVVASTDKNRGEMDFMIVEPPKKAKAISKRKRK